MKYILFVLQFITEFLFGVRVEGEPVPEPTLKTLLPLEGGDKTFTLRLRKSAPPP